MTKTLDNAVGYDFTDKYYANKNGEVFFNKNTGMGAVKRFIGDKVKPFINKFGYVEYILSDTNNNRKHIQAHRIVASLFIENIHNKPQVNHINGIKTDNNINNLEWCTASENEQHSFKVLGKISHNKGKKLPSGKKYKGTIRPVQRFSLDNILEKEYFNPTEAEQDGYSLKQISAVCNNRQKTHKNKIWKYKEHNEN